MTNNSITQSQKRYEESVAKIFGSGRSGKTTLFLTSSTDEGVIRNGGRNGARFAPQSLLSTFKRFALTDNLIDQSFVNMEVSDQLLEQKDFEEAQREESRKISEIIGENRDSRLYHIGGGHDHVYPLLKAVSQFYKKIVVINIDAHADTRTDEAAHSGTPFRQFSKDFGNNFSLFQIGLNNFANSLSTLTSLHGPQQKIIWRSEFSNEKLKMLFSTLQDLVDDQTAVIFSIDADALSACEVPGVSAVNPTGISLHELKEIWKNFQQIKLHHPPIVGIYELNPLYDSLASISMRTLANFIYESL